MVTIDDVDVFFDEMLEITNSPSRKKDKKGISGYFAKRENERWKAKIRKHGSYGRIETLSYLRSVLEDLEERTEYLPIMHEKILLSEVDLDFGPFAEDKKVTSTLYFEPSHYWNGEFVCYDDTGDSIGWIRVACCDAFGGYSAVVQNNYGSKAEEIIRKQLADGVEIALEKLLDAGRDYLERIEEQKYEKI